MTETVASTGEIFFPRGIPGFETQTRYGLSHSDTPSGRIYWLEALDQPAIRFTLVDPRLYGLNYVLELTDDEQSVLQAERPDDVVVLLMLWKPDEPDPSAHAALNANIGGPILLNVERRLGMQKLLVSPRVELNIME